MAYGRKRSGKGGRSGRKSNRSRGRRRGGSRRGGKRLKTYRMARGGIRL